MRRKRIVDIYLFIFCFFIVQVVGAPLFEGKKLRNYSSWCNLILSGLDEGKETVSRTTLEEYLSQVIAYSQFNYSAQFW